MSIDPTRIDIASDDETDPLTCRMSGYTMHGNVPFDVPFITEIADNLYQGGCETGLVLPPVIKHVVSLYPWETYTIQHEVQSSLAYVAYDSEQDDMIWINPIVAWVQACRKTGPVLVHCQAGLNRSSTVVARVLIDGGMTGEEAIAMLREKRSKACLCNPAFEAYIKSFA